MEWMTPWMQGCRAVSTHTGACHLVRLARRIVRSPSCRSVFVLSALCAQSGASLNLDPKPHNYKPASSYPIKRVHACPVACSSGNTVVQNILFRNCKASAIIVDTGSTVPVYITNCAFYNNSGEKGPAIYVKSGSVIISSSLFLGNTPRAGGTVYVTSGATATLSSNVFDMNGARCGSGRMGPPHLWPSHAA